MPSNSSKNIRCRVSLLATLSIAILVVAACSGDASSDGDAESITVSWQENLNLSVELQEATERLWYLCAEENGIDPDELPKLESAQISDMSYEDAMGPAVPRVNEETASDVGYEHFYPAFFEESTGTTQQDELTYDQAVVLYGEDYVEAVWDSDGYVVDPPGVIEIEFEEWNVSTQRHTDGCAGEVDELIFEDEIVEFLTSQLAATAGLTPSTTEHDDFIDAQLDWAECMRDRGHEEIEEYGSVLALLMIGRAEQPEEEFDQFQIDLAVDDAQCSEEHDVNAINREVFESLVLEFHDEFEQEFYAYHEMASDALDRAQELIAEGAFDS